MIVLIFTGGTISMRHDPVSGGAVPTLSGKQILELTPGLDQVAQLEIDDWGAFPGPHMNVGRMWALRERIVHHLARPEVDGVVVTHGTDSLEETAYLVARSVDSAKPVVFTGAMRTSSDLGWDGPANLSASVRVAASADARGVGAVVVLADHIFGGLDVTKVHTHKLESFDSPESGPLGVVDDNRVMIRYPLSSPPPIIAAPSLAEPIDIIFTYSGADSSLLEASRPRARGVVIAAMGRGNVPPTMVDGIDGFVAENKPVVITSRALRGRVGHTYGYAGGGRRLSERGAIFAGARRPQQARIDVMLALGAGMSVSEIRALLEDS